MAEQRPLTFTEEEQLLLGELDTQVQEYTNWRNSVSRCLHAGQDSALISRLIKFLEHMAIQAAKQIDDVKAKAEARAKEPKPAVVAEPKAN